MRCESPVIGLLIVLGGALFAADARADEFGERLATAAQAQVGVTTTYDPAYVRLEYPGGDVAADRGVCTDVVIRAYRSLGADLQVLVHEDLRRASSSYPKLWGSSRPDTNIDHRRVPNLQTYFTRHGESLPVSREGRDYLVGDLVTWRLTSGVPHIGIVTAQSIGERPLIVHNIGAGVRVEDMLFDFTITGHYRFNAEVAGSTH